MDTKRDLTDVMGFGDATMSNVIAFARPEPREPSLKAIDGATLFMHIRKTTLIVHLANNSNRHCISDQRK